MRNALASIALAALISAPLVAACSGSSSGGGFGNPSSNGGTGSTGGTGSGPGSNGGPPPVLNADGGSSTAPPLSPDAGCATATAAASRSPVYMLFVLDGSGSMGQENKWTAATGALTTIFGGMTNDPSLGVGLIVFSDSQDQTTGSGPGPYPEPGIDVPVGYVTSSQLSALDARMSGSPNSNTPTYYALQGGYGELGSFVPSAPLENGGSKVLVLITDGVPTDQYCSIKHAGTNYPSNPCVTMAGQELTGASKVLTFVIGVGPFPSSNGQEFDPAWLGNLAQAGGGAPKGCNPNETQSTSNLCYFEVDPTQATSAASLQAEFTKALDAIRGQVLTCTFPLQTTGLGSPDPNLVNVTVDGTLVPESSTNGWSYDNPQNPTAIIFNGAACTSLKADAMAKVSIVVGCATIAAK